jgi:Type I restriction enzyme R protein N terminus (HSDR_N)
MKEAASRIKINKLLETAGWRFFAEGKLPANIQLEPKVTIKVAELDALGNDFEKTKNGFIDFLLLDARGFPLIVLEAKAEDKNPLVGKEQARKYARSQNCRFVILSNGNLHYFWDLDRGNPYIITSFPTPESVMGYQKMAPDPKRLIEEPVAEDYIVLTQRPTYASEAGWKNETERPGYIQLNKLRFLRPYQLRAIHSLQRAVKDDKDRFLFEMATGTACGFQAIMKQPAPGRFVAFLAIALAILTVAFSADSTFAATPIIPIGQQVFTTGTTNVRATADGTLVGTQPRFAVGSIAAGPTTVSGNSVTWYKVSFNQGVSGWVGADMLLNGLPGPKSADIGIGRNQNMILDELGNIEVAFASGLDSNGNAIYSFAESTNQGLTFTKPIVLPMATRIELKASEGPQVAAERNGAIDIVYTCLSSVCHFDIGNPGVALIRSIDHGSTWSAPIQISVPPHSSELGAGDPVIAACGAGVTVAWLDDGVGSNASQLNDDLFVVQVLNGVPGPPINVTFSTGGEKQPQIVVNPQGTVYLSWVSNPDDVGGSAGTSFGPIKFVAIPNCAAVQQ